MSNKEILINYLNYLIDNLKKDNLNDNLVHKLFQIMYLNNCEIEEQKDLINYTFLGWYISNYQKLFTEN
jgi:hypothetical protein